MGRRTVTGPGAPLPPTLIYIAGFALGWWLDARLPLTSTARFPVALEWSGWLLAAGGAGLFVWGLATFARMRTGILLQKPATRIVDTRPYSWSRNPQYVSFTMMYVGLALALGVRWPLLLTPLVVVLVTVLVIAREERYLRTTFGDAYADYCRRVRRWI
jgi:protein-S-isoprenylcysteine O-methyltransferase Ste14